MTLSIFNTTLKMLKKKKLLLNCSNHEFAGCKAKFSLISKNTTKVQRPGKKTVFKMNQNLDPDVENWEVEPNSGKF